METILSHAGMSTALDSWINQSDVARLCDRYEHFKVKSDIQRTVLNRSLAKVNGIGESPTNPTSLKTS